MKIIKVSCSDCHESFDEKKVDILDCWEGPQMRDIVKFICPECKKEQESFRVS
jgi:hypothetical protein